MNRLYIFFVSVIFFDFSCSNGNSKISGDWKFKFHYAYRLQKGNSLSFNHFIYVDNWKNNVLNDSMYSNFIQVYIDTVSQNFRPVNKIYFVRSIEKFSMYGDDIDWATVEQNTVFLHNMHPTFDSCDNRGKFDPTGSTLKNAIGVSSPSSLEYAK